MTYSSSAYLDHAASAPLRPSAWAAMEPFGAQIYANPMGAHRQSRLARKALDEARDSIAENLGVNPGEIVFTSGGTESDNTVVLGSVRRKGGIAVTSATEHHAVLHPVEHLGGKVIAANSHGAIDLSDLEDFLSVNGENVSLVSVMAVNNEVGTVTDMAAVASIVRRLAPQAILHSDAVQAAGWIDLCSITSKVDSISLSAHKFGGPKGVGVLWLRSGVHVEPLMFGGGQERDRRSGTHNVAGIVGTSIALRESCDERKDSVVRIGALRDRLVDTVANSVGGINEVVPRGIRVPGSAHICVEGVESESLLFMLDEAGVSASAASACASGAMEPSHVLAAMGVDRNLSRGALRMSLGHRTTDGEIDYAIKALTSSISHLRGAR